MEKLKHLQDEVENAEEIQSTFDSLKCLKTSISQSTMAKIIEAFINLHLGISSGSQIVGPNGAKVCPNPKTVKYIQDGRLAKIVWRRDRSNGRALAIFYFYADFYGDLNLKGRIQYPPAFILSPKLNGRGQSDLDQWELMLNQTEYTY